MRNSSFPSFFYDSSGTDKCEEVIDYFLSWTLRCAQKKYKDLSYGMVHTYAKRILSQLLFENPNELENRDVEFVKTWKQSDKIDLWVEIEIEVNSKKHILVIENKLYAPLEQHQLPTYKAIVQEYYSGKEDEFNIHYIFLRCDDKHKDTDLNLCTENGYRPVLLRSLVDAMNVKEVTGHDLFDEFWFYWWQASSLTNI